MDIERAQVAQRTLEEWRRFWREDPGQQEANRRYREAHPAGSVPAVADVLRIMREEHLDQDEAVRRLGGTP